jgi:type IV pilus assembly protein PilC
MIAVGESTGRLDDMLARIAQFYTRSVDATVGNLVELIQPFLMVVIGALVGLLFASILLPIYNLVQVF